MIVLGAQRRENIDRWPTTLLAELML
eukprot:COSAG02_NODE_18924_length_910_cov_1.178792_2_plen_25_part_01